MPQSAPAHEQPVIQGIVDKFDEAFVAAELKKHGKYVRYFFCRAEARTLL